MGRVSHPRAAYLIAALFIFAVEVVIALYVRDDFVRPYLGDVLAVMLVYCAVRTVGFGVLDLVAYAAGGVVVVAAEAVLRRR